MLGRVDVVGEARLPGAGFVDELTDMVLQRFRRSLEGDRVSPRSGR